LEKLETAFGRLAYLSSLCDGNTGHYAHYGLSQIYGDPEAERTLRESHLQLFREWLAMPLELRKTDLDRYLQALEGGARQAVETWRDRGTPLGFAPAGALGAERELYEADFSALLRLLELEHGAGAPDPDGLPRP
jgi:hypothetical protein